MTESYSVSLPAPRRPLELEGDVEHVRKMQATLRTIAERLGPDMPTLLDALYRTHTIVRRNADDYGEFIDDCPPEMTSDLSVAVRALKECARTCRDMERACCDDALECEARLRFVCLYAALAMEDIELLCLRSLPHQLTRHGYGEEAAAARREFEERDATRRARLGL